MYMSVVSFRSLFLFQSRRTLRSAYVCVCVCVCVRVCVCVYVHMNFAAMPPIRLPRHRREDPQRASKKARISQTVAHVKDELADTLAQYHGTRQDVEHLQLQISELRFVFFFFFFAHLYLFIFFFFVPTPRFLRMCRK
jgi:hypothetical protein